MKCIYCGNEINDAAKFCNFCGKPVGAPIEEESFTEDVEPEIEEEIHTDYETAPLLTDDGVSRERPHISINRNLLFVLIVVVIGVCVGVGLRVARNPQRHVASSSGQMNYDTNGENPLTNDTQSSNGLTNEEDDFAMEETYDTQDDSYAEDSYDMTESEDAAGTIQEEDTTSSDEMLQTEEPVSEYILNGSDTRYITESELEGFTAEQCRLARNELYARHGRMFDDENLQAYFNQFDWYQPAIRPEDFQESYLNVYEIANRDLIVKYEEEHGYR